MLQQGNPACEIPRNLAACLSGSVNSRWQASPYSARLLPAAFKGFILICLSKVYVC